MKRILLITLIAAIAFGCSKKKVVEGTYENGNPRVVKYYHKNAGNLILDREVVYYENEQKKIDGEYKDKQRNGKWQAWYENGTIWSEGEYKNGKRNGIGIAYHENGKKYIEGNPLQLRHGVPRWRDHHRRSRRSAVELPIGLSVRLSSRQRKLRG